MWVPVSPLYIYAYCQKLCSIHIIYIHRILYTTLNYVMFQNLGPFSHLNSLAWAWCRCHSTSWPAAALSRQTYHDWGWFLPPRKMGILGMMWDDLWLGLHGFTIWMMKNVETWWLDKMNRWTLLQNYLFIPCRTYAPKSVDPVPKKLGKGLINKYYDEFVNNLNRCQPTMHQNTYLLDAHGYNIEDVLFYLILMWFSLRIFWLNRPRVQAGAQADCAAHAIAGSGWKKTAIVLYFEM